MKPLDGIHHVTAMTSDAERIYTFFTAVLGMRLVKKTVNQDDVSAYHLFFADDEGRAGTDMTFFEFPAANRGRDGTDAIVTTSFRVADDAAIAYWLKRFNRFGVEHDDVRTLFGAKTLPFVDFDGQRYQLISDRFDTGVASGRPWKNGPVPHAYAITGLGPVVVRVSSFEEFKARLEDVYMFEETAVEGAFHLFETGRGGHGASIVVEDAPTLLPARQGIGSVHHVAFRVEDLDALKRWIERYRRFGIRHSGHVERYYFDSLYARAGKGVLFEIATDGPGFRIDEPYDTLGERLSLPPFLEAHRKAIERRLRDFDTGRSTRDFSKEDSFKLKGVNRLRRVEDT